MNEISCPECRAKLGDEYIRCPECHAFVLDSSPWRSDHNLIALPGAVLLWWGLDTLLRWKVGHYYDDWISRSILLMGVYGVIVLLAKYRVSERQARAFRVIRTLVGDGGLGPDTLHEARERLRAAGLRGYNRFIAYHRLQWLLTAEAAAPDIRLGLLEAQRQHADTDWDGLDSAFASAQFLIWLLPSVGFLGTVYGMSGALMEFQNVVGQSDLAFRNGLEGTVSGLATAFHTTLVGLASVIPVLALATVVRRQAQGLLEQTDKYFIRLAAEQLGDPQIPVADAEMPMSPDADATHIGPEAETTLATPAYVAADDPAEREAQPVATDDPYAADATAPARIDETRLAMPAFDGVRPDDADDDEPVDDEERADARPETT